MSVKNVKVRARKLAERQGGAVARRQLLDLPGCDRTRIERWLANGTLVKVHCGVYAFGIGTLSYHGRLMAALLHAGDGAALAGASAAHWWGLIEHPPARIDVAAPGRAGPDPLVRIRRREALALVRHRGFPLTTVPQTLLDLAGAGATHHELRRLLAEAEYRRLLRVADVERLLAGGCRGRRGAAALRRALEAHQPKLARTRSQLERDFIALIEKHGLPLPEINARVGRMTVDALWAEQRVIVELDGIAGHHTPAQLDRDRRRDLHLRSLGYTVLRYGWRQLVEQPELIIAELRRALGPSA